MDSPAARDPRDDPTASRPASVAGLRLLAIWDGGRATFDLPPRGSFVIGRGREADLCVAHASVSRRHARLHVGGAIELEDLGSANGTWVEGRSVDAGERVAAERGALLELGSVRVVVHDPFDAGPSPMAEVDATIGRVAPSDLSVLVIGESGAGKELVTESIHRRSLRRSGPLLKLNCAALPEGLLESELFGHERGAFSGAAQAKPGLFEAANGGTVLLDEVGELPLLTQAKLLRAVESREVLRIGALKPRPINVRFICATHRRLDLLVVEGKFRNDLLYRLDGITLFVPPLRRRAVDIPALAATILGDACGRASRPPVALSDDALLLLSAYRWPGNVRELRNVVERALLHTSGERIEVRDIQLGMPHAPAAPRASAPPRAPDESSAAPVTERERIERALAQCNGNQKEAANRLGMTRRKLVYWLEKLDLPRPRKRT